MSDHQSVQVIPDMPDNPSLEEEAAAMEQQASEPQAPEEGQVEQHADERPGWLPEKFDSPEALAAAYQPLQAEYSRIRNGEEDVAENETTTINPLSEEDMMPFTAEFEQTGDLSETSRDAIAQRGIPREMVDRYVEGMQAQTQMEMMSVYNSVGGEDTYNSMMQWAAENMDETSIDTFNRIVMGGDTNSVMFAVNSVRNQWEAAGNSPRPELLQGSTGHQGASEAFQSLAQVTEAMKDPRYKTDPAYRRSIENRLSQSQVL